MCGSTHLFLYYNRDSLFLRSFFVHLINDTQSNRSRRYLQYSRAYSFLTMVLCSGYQPRSRPDNTSGPWSVDRLYDNLVIQRDLKDEDPSTTGWGQRSYLVTSWGNATLLIWVDYGYRPLFLHPSSKLSCTGNHWSMTILRPVPSGNVKVLFFYCVLVFGRTTGVRSCADRELSIGTSDLTTEYVCPRTDRTMVGGSSSKTLKGVGVRIYDTERSGTK